MSAISGDLFGSVQWGMQFILDGTGLGGEGKGGEEGMLAQLGGKALGLLEWLFLTPCMV